MFYILLVMFIGGLGVLRIFIKKIVIVNIDNLKIKLSSKIVFIFWFLDICMFLGICIIYVFVEFDIVFELVLEVVYVFGCIEVFFDFLIDEG